MPPPWATIDTLPGFIGTNVKLAYADTSGSAFCAPWEFGPKMRMPYLCAKRDHLLLALDPFRAYLLEPGRVDDGELDALLAALLDDRRE